MMARARRRCVGLDIGQSGVRAVELSQDSKSGAWRWERAASVGLSPGVIVAGGVEDAKALRSAIRHVWKAGRITAKDVVLSVPNALVMTRQVDLPWMPEDDFREALRYQLGDVLPVELSTVEVDYHRLDELRVVDERGVANDINRILVVAAPTNTLSELSAVAESAGLTPIAADTESFALIRAACAGRLTTGGPLSAIAEAGSAHLTVVLHQDGQPRFVRTVSGFGGHEATAAIAERLGLDWDEAEDLKRDTGLNGPVPVHAAVSESSVFGGVTKATSPLINPRAAVTIEVLNTWASALIAEIRNSLEYFRAAEPGASVDSLVLCGGTFALTGLVDRVATQLRMPARLLNPELGIPVSPRFRGERPVDSRFALAAGLAMGAMR